MQIVRLRQRNYSVSKSLKSVQCLAGRLCRIIYETCRHIRCEADLTCKYQSIGRVSQTGPSVTCSQTHDMTTYLEDNTVTVNVKKTINNRIDVRPMRGLNIHVVSLEMVYSDAKHISCAIDSHRCLVSISH